MWEFTELCGIKFKLSGNNYEFNWKYFKLIMNNLRFLDNQDPRIWTELQSEDQQFEGKTGTIKVNYKAKINEDIEFH